MNADTHTSGSTVKNHISLRTVFEYSVIRKTSYQSWFLVYQRVLPQACLFQHPWHLRGRKLIIPSLPQARLSDHLNHTTWLNCLHARVTPYSCHPWWAVDCFSLCLRSDLLCVSLLNLALLFLLLPVLCPEPFLPCGKRQGNETLCLQQLRSLALWQNSLLP